MDEWNSTLAAQTAVKEKDEGFYVGVSSAQRAAVVEDLGCPGDLVEDLVIADCLAEARNMGGSADWNAGIALSILPVSDTHPKIMSPPPRGGKRVLCEVMSDDLPMLPFPVPVRVVIDMV